MEKPEHSLETARPTIEVKILDDRVRQHLPHYATAG